MDKIAHPRSHSANRKSTISLPTRPEQIEVVEQASLIGAFHTPLGRSPECLSLVIDRSQDPYIGYHDGKAPACPIAVSIAKSGEVNVQLCQRGHNPNAPVHNLSLDRLIAIVESVIMTERS